MNKFFATCVALCLATSANAATIYDESVSGDLDEIGSTIVALGLGTNQILGSLPATSPAATDRIRFSQAPGLQVDSIVLTFTGGWDTQNIGQSLNSALFNNSANLFDDNFGMITGSPNNAPTITAAFFDSFGPETGPLSRTSDCGQDWDFQLSTGVAFPGFGWTMTVETSTFNNTANCGGGGTPGGGGGTPVVPVPASLPLLVLGAAVLGLMRRRKSAA